jgi:hypothetical protein
MGVIRTTKPVTGGPDDIVKALSPEEQHQMLLLLPDVDLVKFIDELVARREIRIPPDELRKPKTYKYGLPSDSDSQLSSLGVSSTRHPPTIKLGALIWNTYEKLGIQDELSWRVRGHLGTTIRHSVIDFIRTHGPRSAISELILPSRTVAIEIADYLNMSISSDNDDVAMCSRMLWKLGFNIPRFEDEYVLLRNRVAEFKESVLRTPRDATEENRAEIRSSGVNLFVSIERFLEELLHYNLWLTASDHFTGTKFDFNREYALSIVPKMLGATIQTGEETFEWSQDGSNTLGALLAYLQAFRKWLRSRQGSDRSAVERKEQDFPHYSSDTLRIFPFKHTQLWADSSGEVMAAYTELIEKVCAQLAQAEIPLVRNGLDHKREEGRFPDSDKLLAFITRFEQVVDVVDSSRLIPKLFWCTKTERDADGNTCVTFNDYRNAAVPLWKPSVVVPGPSVRFDRPFLIAPFDFLGLPNSTLVFTLSAPTEYSKYWANYPRRRLIDPIDEELHPGSAVSQ